MAISTTAGNADGSLATSSPKSSPYITPEGFDDLQDELKEIWVRRRDVVKALSAAAAEGDRSENAEYIYRKKELAGLDRRIRYLQKRLPDLNIVRESPSSSAVFFGAWVDVLDAEDVEKTYRIVGPDEADAAAASISVDSPLARAMLKKQVGDEVTIEVGDRSTRLEISAIRYKA